MIGGIEPRCAKMTDELTGGFLVEDEADRALLAHEHIFACEALQKRGITTSVQQDNCLFPVFQGLIDLTEKGRGKDLLFSGRRSECDFRKGRTVNSSGKAQEGVTVGPCVIERFRKWCSRTQNDRDLTKLCIFQGKVADIKGESFPRLIGRIMLFVHDNQSQMCQWREKGGSGTDDKRHLSPENRHP